MTGAREWLSRIRDLPRDGPVKIMNVCGGHERTIALSGLRSVLPDTVVLIAGPGCPVCVCPEEDVYQAIQLALRSGVMLVAFGDMLRVPVNLPKREVRSLEQAKAAGADVRAVASPREAVQLALRHPGREVVFFAAGFETTMAPVAASLLEGAPENLSVLLAGRLTWPAVRMLLESEDSCLDALIVPGHVSTVMGLGEWSFVVEAFGLPAAAAGFTPDSLLAAIYSVLRQRREGAPFLDNCYARVIRPDGNPAARDQLRRVFGITGANWRGVGPIPASGYVLRPPFDRHDARLRFPDFAQAGRKRAGDMPAGCDCARVVLGKIRPVECTLYGIACTPQSPVGPCMVSDEGACRIGWTSGERPHAAHH